MHKTAQKDHFTLKELGQEYAQVNKLLGNRRLEVSCFDGRTRLAHIRGAIKKREWVSVGDIVLVALRDFQDDKCDIILLYNADEARQLKIMGELPEFIKINVRLEENNDDDGTAIQFDDI